MVGFSSLRCHRQLKAVEKAHKREAHFLKRCTLVIITLSTDNVVDRARRLRCWPRRRSVAVRLCGFSGVYLPLWPASFRTPNPGRYPGRVRCKSSFVLADDETGCAAYRYNYFIQSSATCYCSNDAPATNSYQETYYFQSYSCADFSNVIVREVKDLTDGRFKKCTRPSSWWAVRRTLSRRCPRPKSSPLRRHTTVSSLA